MPRFLGQHFLKNQAIIKQITAALELQKGDRVVEIGPGHGELTGELLRYPIKLIAVEKDGQLADELESRIRNQELWGGEVKISNLKFQILEGDILKFLKKNNSKFKLTGNIPYYITGHLLRIISELEKKPSLTVLTMQKEVAERIVAKPPQMNRLAAITQFWSEPEIITTIPPEDFDPPPEVESAVIKLKTKSEKRKINERDYYKIVKILFQQPRKTIINNLSADLKTSRKEIEEKLKAAGINGEERPQNLSVEDVENLVNYLVI